MKCCEIQCYPEILTTRIDKARSEFKLNESLASFMPCRSTFDLFLTFDLLLTHGIAVVLKCNDLHHSNQVINCCSVYY